MELESLLPEVLRLVVAWRLGMHAQRHLCSQGLALVRPLLVCLVET